jgi:hypothetical protein
LKREFDKIVLKYHHFEKDDLTERRFLPGSFCTAEHFPVPGGAPVLLAFRQHQLRRSTAVDLALKLNVLVVCAVFAFVGAILLGAF